MSRWNYTATRGGNFESRLVREVLEWLWVRKTRTTTLHPQPDGMVERYVRTIEEHLRKVVSGNKRDWDERLPLFLLAYWAATYKTTGVTPANLVFGAPPHQGYSVTDYAANLAERLCDTHNFARQHLKVASD